MGGLGSTIGIPDTSELSLSGSAPSLGGGVVPPPPDVSALPSNSGGIPNPPWDDTKNAKGPSWYKRNKSTLSGAVGDAFQKYDQQRQAINNRPAQQANFETPAAPALNLNLSPNFLLDFLKQRAGGGDNNAFYGG